MTILASVAFTFTSRSELATASMNRLSLAGSPTVKSFISSRVLYRLPCVSSLRMLWAISAATLRWMEASGSNWGSRMRPTWSSRSMVFPSKTSSAGIMRPSSSAMLLTSRRERPTLSCSNPWSRLSATSCVMRRRNSGAAKSSSFSLIWMAISAAASPFPSLRAISIFSRFSCMAGAVWPTIPRSMSAMRPSFVTKTLPG